MAPDSKKNGSRNSNKQFLIDLARSFGGAIVFSFPILMTMETWRLGFYMNGLRLTLLILLTVLLLIGLSHYRGFQDTFTGRDTVLEAFNAYAVGFITSTIVLILFGVIKPGMSADEIMGKISIQTVTGSLGAMFAQSLFGGRPETDDHTEKQERSSSYAGQLFLMGVGAIFLSMSVSPTEEMALISYQMTNWHTAGLAILSLLIVHAFMYAIEWQGKEEEISFDVPWWSIFLRFTVVGYAVVLLISFYILWTFGTIDGISFAEQVRAAVVLGFPAALGGGASRLIL